MKSALSGCPPLEIWQGAVVRRGGWRVDAKRNLLGRAVGYLSFSAWLAWRLTFRTRADSHLLVVTNPPFSPIVVWICSMLRGWRYDIILHDLYPDGLVAIGSLTESSPITSIWRGLNKRTFARARKILVLGRDMERLVRIRYRVSAGKIGYMPHWSPHVPSVLKPAVATRLWSRLNLHDQFVVQYSGNMGLWHDIDTIVHAAWLLRRDKEILFLLIGQGRRRARAEERSRKLGADNILWLPFQPIEVLADSLGCCHAALISQRAGLEGIAVPSKLYGILASGRAVLAQVPATSETALVVREEECGLVILPGDAQALADAIQDLANDRLKSYTMGVKSLAAYRRKYTLEAAVGRLEALLAADPDKSMNKRI
jgi:glycosyltransferase involved in cell wall biosynthesis